MEETAGSLAEMDPGAPGGIAAVSRSDDRRESGTSSGFGVTKVKFSRVFFSLAALSLFATG